MGGIISEWWARSSRNRWAASSESAAGMLGDNDFRSPLVQFGDDRVGIKGLVTQEPTKLDAFDQRGDPDRIEALTGH